MKVRATRIGFYEHIRRREGDVFTIPDTPRRKLTEREAKMDAFDSVKDKQGTVPQAFGSWMEPVDERTAEKTSTAQEAVNKASAEIKGSKAAANGQASTGDAEVI